MKICKDNPLKEIKKIVESKAKFQKVMLFFDDSVSSVEINEVYEAIKDLCIYNQSHVKQFDKSEILNGYRLIIYFCEVESLFKFDIDKNEFINVYFMRENTYLPCFLTQFNCIDNSESFLVADTSKLDFSMMTSVNFNMFYNYLKNLLCGQNYMTNIGMMHQVVNNYNMFEFMNDIKEKMFFIDVDIIKKCEIEYKDIVFVDLILIDAIMLMLTSVKTNNYMLVDVYKAGKDDDALIEKLYRLYNNDMVKNLIVLNFNCLYNYCLKTKQKIKEYVGFFDVDAQRINEIVEKVKIYSKNSNDIVGYLYLYNIFNV